MEGPCVGKKSIALEIAPIIMSLMAFLLVFAFTGWRSGSTDRKGGAHILPLLIVTRIPTVVLFIAIVNWRQYLQALWSAAFQVLATTAAVVARL